MADGGAAARIAGATYALLGVAFGTGAVWARTHLLRTGELPMTPFGFRALSGPFEQLGTERFSALALALAAVSALNVLAGTWLWRGERRGLRLGLGTFAPTMALGVGFALPFLLIGMPIGIVFAVAGRRTLRGRESRPTVT
jgi:hypothetical protein